MRKMLKLFLSVFIALTLVGAKDVFAKKKSSKEDAETETVTKKARKHAKKAKESADSTKEEAKGEVKKTHRRTKKVADEAESSVDSKKEELETATETGVKKSRRRAKKASEDLSATTEAGKDQAEAMAQETTEKIHKRSKRAKADAVEAVETAAPVEEPAPAEKEPSRSSWKDLFGGASKSAESKRSGGSHRVDGKLDLNTATASELEAIPGVGPVTAQKIIDNRPYGRKDELKV